MTPSLGKFVDGATCVVDLAQLLETRMLIQANSGGGKSRALRRLLEQLAGKVQQLIVDPEGEFQSLREKFDLVVCAATGGDAATHPRTAALLARRLLETEASAVLDISELKAHERHAFVRLFFESLIEAPKSLRHPVLVALDEAQIYAPERGQGESEATSAVIDIAARGRKRGLCLIAATQRMGMLNKSVAGELKNKLIGATGLDVDVKRAAFDLGLQPREALAQLRGLAPGHFFAFGPAIGQRDPRELITGDVVTTHPKVGQRQAIATPKPTAAILALLPKLADLPKEAESEARTLEQLKRELSTATREVARLKKAGSAPSPESIAEAEKRGTDRATARAATEAHQLMALAKRTFQKAAHLAVDEAFESVDINIKARPAGSTAPPVTVRASGPAPTPKVLRTAPPSGERLPPGETAVLAGCIQYPDGLQRTQLTVLTGYKRSSRDAYIQRLRERGYVTTVGDRVTATPEGIDAMPDAAPLPVGEALQDYWLGRLPKGEAELLKILIAVWPEPIARDALGESTGFQRSSRDAYLQRMRAKELIQEPARGMVIASRTLFQ